MNPIILAFVTTLIFAIFLLGVNSQENIMTKVFIIAIVMWWADITETPVNDSLEISHLDGELLYFRTEGECYNHINDNVTELNCKHTFHTKCIKEWLKEYDYKCPVCRKESGKPKYDL